VFRDNSIYILSGPLSQLPSRFLDGSRGVRGKGLFHLSDESFRGYESYANFDFVSRNYHSAIVNNTGIMTVPLGFTNDMMSLSQTPPRRNEGFYGPFAGFKRASGAAPGSEDTELYQSSD
jgi:hypothetical protein